MSSSYIDVDVKCPFYHKCDSNKRVITCEGIAKTENINMRFKNKSEQKAYMDAMCCSNYLKCELYKIIELKY